MYLYDANGNQIEVSGSSTETEVVETVSEPENGDIPRVYFLGEKPTTKNDVLAEMSYVSKTLSFKAYVKIKCQGSSSMNYPKKNYTINMYEDAERTIKLKKKFRNWTKQSKYCLKANWIDITHSRNVCNAKLWGQIIKTRSDYDNLPEELRTAPNGGAVDGFPILVFYNGIYEGRYTWNIPKDGWMFNMDEDNLSHGILCGESNTESASLFRAEASINGLDWSDELRDVTPIVLKTSFNNAINFVINSTDEEFVSNLGEYFDVQSLIDRDIFGQVICDLDGFGKNQIFYTYDGKHWGASPYDLDSTWCLWHNGNNFVAVDYPRTSFQDWSTAQGQVGNLLYVRLESLFADNISARYKELRDGVLSVSNIIETIECFNSGITKEMIEEDYATTTGDGQYTEIPLKDENTLQKLREFIRTRIEYVDSMLMSEGVE